MTNFSYIFSILGHNREIYEVDKGIYITNLHTAIDERTLKDFKIRNVFSFYVDPSPILKLKQKSNVQSIIYKKLNIKHQMISINEPNDTNMIDLIDFNISNQFNFAYKKLDSIREYDQNRCIVHGSATRMDIAYSFIIYFLSKKHNVQYQLICKKLKNIISELVLTDSILNCLKMICKKTPSTIIRSTEVDANLMENNKKKKKHKTVRFVDPIVTDVFIVPRDTNFLDECKDEYQIKPGFILQNNEEIFNADIKNIKDIGNNKYDKDSECIFDLDMSDTCHCIQIPNLSESNVTFDMLKEEKGNQYDSELEVDNSSKQNNDHDYYCGNLNNFRSKYYFGKKNVQRHDICDGARFSYGTDYKFRINKFKTNKLRSKPIDIPKKNKMN